MKILNYKKLVALLLAAAITFSLGACVKRSPGGDPGGEENPSTTGNSPPSGGIPGAQKVKLEHVYIAEYLDFELPQNEYINAMSTSGDLVYLSTYYYNESTDADGNYTYESGTNLYSMSFDGSDFTLIKNFPQTNEQGENGQSYRYSYISNITPAPDGTIWYYLQETYEDYSDPDNYVYESTGNLVRIDAQGNEMSRYDVSSMSDSEYFYISQFLIKPSGELVLFYDSGVLVLDKDGALSFKINTGTNGWFGGVAMTGNGDVIGNYTSYDETADMVGISSSKFVRINFATQSLDELPKPEMTAYNFRNGPGNTILFYNNMALFSYDIMTHETKEELNWINSDMIAYRINNVTALGEGRFLSCEYTKSYDKMRFAILKKASDTDITEKYLITLAAVYPNEDILDLIVAYNKQNPDYRIQLNDYSVYNTEENWEAGMEQLNIDMVSGKIPDILMLEGLPYNNYATKGLLADLGKLMDADPDFNRADYLENILEATKVNGKIYSLIPSFNISTISAKTENVGTEPGWTLTDLQALMKRFPGAKAFSMMTRSEVLNHLSNMTMDSYVNISTGECRFNTPDFVGMLEFINTFPETIDWDSYYSNLPDDYWEQEQWQYRDNRTLLRMEYVSNFSSIKEAEYTFGGEVTYIGFPCPEGVGSSIMPVFEIAISSKTKFTPACWEFLKSVISEEVQNELNYSFPLRVDALEKMKELAMTQQDNSGGPIIYEKAIAIDEPYPGGGDWYSKPVTQQQADKVMKLIMSVDSVMRDNEEILKIIEEDAAAFFAGQKTAQAVADTIQSRAWIYVSENS